MVAGPPGAQQYRGVRIVSGCFGGRVLRTPPGAATRPTSEKVRQALFNILGPAPADSHVLDLFAGSGALGLEALSRGAATVTFVDGFVRSIIGFGFFCFALALTVDRLGLAAGLACALAAQAAVSGAVLAYTRRASLRG